MGRDESITQTKKPDQSLPHFASKWRMKMGFKLDMGIAFNKWYGYKCRFLKFVRTQFASKRHAK